MASGNTAGDLFDSGALNVWDFAFRQAGGGARGRAAADRAVARRFPDASTATRRVIQTAGLDSLAAGRRYNTAGGGYQLPADAYADLSSYQRRSGSPGETLYGHRITYQYNTVSPGGEIKTHTRSLPISDTRRLTYDQLMDEAHRQATLQIALQVGKSPDSLGRFSGLPQNITIEAAYRYVG